MGLRGVSLLHGDPIAFDVGLMFLLERKIYLQALVIYVEIIVYAVEEKTSRTENNGAALRFTHTQTFFVPYHIHRKKHVPVQFCDQMILYQICVLNEMQCLYIRFCRHVGLQYIVQSGS